MTVRSSQQQVPHDAVALDMSLHETSFPRSKTCKAPIPPSKRKETTSLPVRTEFVFTADVDYKSVMLCGDWCNWQPIQMTLEQERVWSVITIAPSGYREFCYVADGRLRISPKHPTNIEGTRNWRMVYGPPPRRRRKREKRTWLVRTMDNLADSVRAVLLSTFHNEGYRRRELAAGNDVEDGDTIVALHEKRSCGRRCGLVLRGWGPFKVVMGPLGKVWMAATLGESKISKSFATTAKIHVLCQNIENPATPFALRLSASLMLGVVRVYSKKSTIILTDVNAVLGALKRYTSTQDRSRGTKRKGEKSVISGLPGGGHEVARFESITLPVSKKRKTRTYAFPTRSESRSQASRGTESLPHLSSSYLGETGEIDVLREMETLYPSTPIPRLGEHLRSGTSPSSGYQSGNQRQMLYMARDQDITMTAPPGNLDDLEFAMFDEDLPVSSHSDPLSAGGDGLMLADQGGAEEFAAAFGSQRLELDSHRRDPNSQNQRENVPHLPQDEHLVPLGGEGVASKARPSVEGRLSEDKVHDNSGVVQAKSPSKRTPDPEPSGVVDGTTAVARSAAKKTKTRRTVRLLFDGVTELPPSHIRSCLSNASDILLEHPQSRATETKSRRSRSEVDFFGVSGILTPYPQQIMDLWRDVTADVANEISGEREQSSSSLRMQEEDIPAALTDLRISPTEPRTAPFLRKGLHSLTSPVQRSRERDQDVPVPEEMQEEFPMGNSGQRRSSEHKDVPSAEVLRAGVGGGAAVQPDLGSLGAPSHSISGPSSNTFSGKSFLFQRDTIFEDITAVDKRLYEEACQRVKGSDAAHAGSASVERRLSHSQDRSGSHDIKPPDGSSGDGGVLDVRASDFELIEETERPELDPSIGKGPIERIGIRGYKLLQMLRSEGEQKKPNLDTSAEQPEEGQPDITTFEELTANCSRGARARTFFHILNLISSGFVTPTQEVAYGPIILKGGKFF